MMTIKEQFIFEIKGRIALQKDLLKRAKDSADSVRIEGSIDALQGLLNSMDTLSEEPDKSLEEAAKQFVGYDMDTDDLRDYEVGIQAFIAGAEWQAEHLKQQSDE